MPRWFKQSISYIVALSLFAWIFNWKISLALWGGVAWHECGHLLAAKKFGLKTYGFYLIPFVGGAARVDDSQATSAQKSIVLLSGPIAGYLLTVICYLIYHFTGSPFWGACAKLQAVLNLFNLLPLAMLDGGQLVELLAYYVSDLAGALYITCSYIVGTLLLWRFNAVIGMIVGITSYFAILSAWRNYKFITAGYPELAPKKRVPFTPIDVIYTVVLYTLSSFGLWCMLASCSQISIKALWK